MKKQKPKFRAATQKPSRLILDDYACFDHPNQPDFSVWKQEPYEIMSGWVAGKPLGAP